MIFLTVGAQMPFDRLVESVDAWAGRRPWHDVVAQTNATSLRPVHLRWTRVLDPATFRRTMFESSVVVTHAGMGTVLTALELARPVIVMPRLAEKGETRNDHQLATARALASRHAIEVAWDESELPEKLDRLADFAPPPPVPSHASPELLEELRRFIRGQLPELAASRDAGADDDDHARRSLSGGFRFRHAA